MAEWHNFGTSSWGCMRELDAELCAVVELALHKCKIDFSVVETLRSFAQQRLNILNDVSWTMKSNHFPNALGVAGAVDIYPWVDGRTSHQPYHYKLVARAMFEAAIELGVQIRWGGLWSDSKFDPPHWEKVGHKPLPEQEKES